MENDRLVSNREVLHFADNEISDCTDADKCPFRLQ